MKSMKSMKFIIQGQINMELEAEDVEAVKKLAAEKFDELEKLGVKIMDEKVVDKQSGYFLK